MASFSPRMPQTCVALRAFVRNRCRVFRQKMMALNQPFSFGIASGRGPGRSPFFSGMFLRSTLCVQNRSGWRTNGRSKTSIAGPLTTDWGAYRNFVTKHSGEVFGPRISKAGGGLGEQNRPDGRVGGGPHPGSETDPLLAGPSTLTVSVCTH